MDNKQEIVMDESAVKEVDVVEKDNVVETDPTPKSSISVVANFEKISFDAFLQTFTPIFEMSERQKNNIPLDEPISYDRQVLMEAATAIYDNIKLPRRSTAKSAGYDFFFPFGRTVIANGTGTMIPTGIKCNILDGWVLLIVPRSSLGINCRIQLDNTIGVIDGDYYNNPKNEGQIFIQITNDSKEGKDCIIDSGNRFCQGIFVPFGITANDNTTEERVGGIGSTGE